MSWEVGEAASSDNGAVGEVARAAGNAGLPPRGRPHRWQVGRSAGVCSWQMGQVTVVLDRPPHLRQNRLPAGLSDRQPGQIQGTRLPPQPPQNRSPMGFSAWQNEQTTRSRFDTVLPLAPAVWDATQREANRRTRSPAAVASVGPFPGEKEPRGQVEPRPAWMDGYHATARNT